MIWFLNYSIHRDFVTLNHMHVILSSQSDICKQHIASSSFNAFKCNVSLFANVHVVTTNIPQHILYQHYYFRMYCLRIKASPVNLALPQFFSQHYNPVSSFLFSSLNVSPCSSFPSYMLANA